MRVHSHIHSCRSRIRTRAEDPAPPSKPAGEHPLVGLWRGEWPTIDAATEIAIWQVAGDNVHATYCHRHNEDHFVIDLSPSDGHDSRIDDDGKLRFRNASNPTVKWIFTATEEDRLEMRCAPASRRGVLSFLNGRPPSAPESTVSLP